MTTTPTHSQVDAPIAVAILGGTGYGAGELLRLLTQHPLARVVSVVTTSQVGEPVSRAHPHLHGFYEHRFSAEIDLPALQSAPRAVVFSALPHGASSAAVESLIQAPAAAHLRIVDLSGDLRLKDPAIHAAHYPESAVRGELRQAACYGLAELHRDAIRNASIVANPGCLATAAILAGAPLVQLGLTGQVAVDAKTGSSGSGRQLKDTTHHPTRHADFRAYKPLGHQHEPEILQAWGDPRGERISLSFVPQSLPTARGIFVTLHATLSAPSDAAALVDRYRQFYRGSPFVRIVDGSPSLQDVVGSNFCDIAVACRGKQVVIMSALDNLVKGMAGAAIQNMNLMCGLPETSGLWAPSFRPV